MRLWQGSFACGKTSPTERSEAIEKLKAQADAIRALGATSLYLFGSVARDEANAGSDLDLFIDYDPGARFNAFDLVEIKLFLKDELNLSVDITTHDSLHSMLHDRIGDAALQVF
ncbi:nucleotidyltransferase domain-containing protein [Rhizobium tarimense]|nr:nucleotidyltransferase domain-containing protein [Pseudorhizobium tarimense]